MYTSLCILIMGRIASLSSDKGNTFKENTD